LVGATEPTDEALSQRLRDLEALRDQLNKLIKTTQVERPGVASATDISKQKAATT